MEKTILKEPQNKKIKHNELQRKSPRQNNIKQYTSTNFKSQSVKKPDKAVAKSPLGERYDHKKDGKQNSNV